MNAKTETEKLSDVDKQDYRRYQFGGSFGGPIVRTRRTSSPRSSGRSRTRSRRSTTLGLFPSQDGVFPTP